jgi:type II secretory pathway component GspD/PulD (secretin)
VHADTARNALLIRGTEYQVRAALDMAHRLDVPASQPRRSTR